MLCCSCGPDLGATYLKSSLLCVMVSFTRETNHWWSPKPSSLTAPSSSTALHEFTHHTSPAQLLRIISWSKAYKHALLQKIPTWLLLFSMRTQAQFLSVVCAESSAVNMYYWSYWRNTPCNGYSMYRVFNLYWHLSSGQNVVSRVVYRNGIQYETFNPYPLIYLICDSLYALI